MKKYLLISLFFTACSNLNHNVKSTFTTETVDTGTLISVRSRYKSTALHLTYQLKNDSSIIEFDTRMYVPCDHQEVSIYIRKTYEICEHKHYTRYGGWTKSIDTVLMSVDADYK